MKFSKRITAALGLAPFLRDAAIETDLSDLFTVFP